MTSTLLSLSVFFLSLIVAFVAFRAWIPALKKRGITGKDRHKPGQPLVPEMGGLPLVMGFAAGVLLVVAFNAFLDRFLTVSLASTLAVLSVVLGMALIGVVDDLIRMRQIVKAVIPLAAALPLVAVRVGNTSMNLPFWGEVDFGIVYSLVLVPLAVTGAANAVNMLAGFNGEEVGVSAVALFALSVVAYRLHETEALLILFAGLGALLAALYFNWYPAKVFIGDVGTLSIGAIMASAVIIGNFELAGLIVIAPYAIDFLIKAKNRFPTSRHAGSWATWRDGKLYCPESGPMGLGLLVVKLTRGTKERNVALILMGLEAVFGVIAIWYYW